MNGINLKFNKIYFLLFFITLYLLSRMIVSLSLYNYIDKLVPIMLLTILFFCRGSIKSSKGDLFFLFSVLLSLFLLSLQYYTNNFDNLLAILLIFYGLFFNFILPKLLAVKLSNYKTFFINSLFLVLFLNFFVIWVQFSCLTFFDISFHLPWQAISTVRPMGLFSEPAHLGYTFAILICLTDKDISNVKNKVVLLSTSLIITLSLINIVVFVFVIFKVLMKRRVLGLIVGGVVLLVMIPFIIDTSLGKRAMNLENDPDTSTLIRFYKGARVIDLSEYFWTGIGNRNVELNQEYVDRTNFENLKAYEDSTDYYNGIFSELVFLGGIGFLLINFFYYWIFGRFNILFFLFFEFLRLGGSVNYASSICFFYVFFITLCYNNQELDK